MSLETATLIAAIVAAGASIIALFVGLLAGRAAESRAAHRQLLAPDLSQISEVIYSTVACSKILIEAKTEPAVGNWRARAEAAKERLKAIRVKLRYPLWGITDPMNTLTRLPDWIEHARPLDPEHGKRIFAAGKALAWWLDETVRKSYLAGRPPSVAQRLIVNFHSWRLDRAYDRMKTTRNAAA